MNDGHFFSLEGPLDSMPMASQMRAANLTGFGELVRGLGMDPRPILERYHIDPRSLRDPDAYIETKSLVDMLEYCSVSFNDPLFGLRMAQFQDPDVFGSVASLCRSASTFREAVESFINFIPVVHSPVAVLELAEGRETSELRWHTQTDLGQNNQAEYKGTLLILKLLRQVGGRSFEPSYVSLAVDSRARDLPEISNRFGCSFRRSSGNAIGFPTAMLNQPVSSANRLLFRLLGGYLGRVRSASRTSVVERVEDYVRGALSTGHCSIEHCAKKFGTSVRTLQANLCEAGLRFSDILEKQRIEMAKTYLESGEMSLDDVASMLGYAEQSSFGRAFKRWTGATPQRFRKNLELH
ncbi:AraC family transcriptional regulator [Solimonas fluminis]|uniref:AraC family transcriptional regulator n=1 Tax=Solimonas fluminis TaxID=2086571 RepID=A0A2S5THD4_9GAMM|nr:AraC family transcriptional regulator [Solimonas fluminis]PPE74396.1 AraC family transcriptional regulator [Solimonas fluminis]